MSKNTRLIFFDTFLNPSFKMTTIFANVARTATSTIRFIYQEIFPSGIGPLYGIISFFHPKDLMITLAKIIFPLFLKLRM